MLGQTSVTFTGWYSMYGPMVQILTLLSIIGGAIAAVLVTRNAVARLESTQKELADLVDRMDSRLVRLETKIEFLCNGGQQRQPLERAARGP